MTLSLIAAVAKNNVIGHQNDLPWYLPEDLKHFKKITLGKTVLMGRKTYDSIVKRLGKPLPQRKNVVVTRQADYKAADGVFVFHSIEGALKALESEDVYVIGGAEIFRAALPLAGKLYVTHVEGEYKGDVFFPEVDFAKWKKTEEETHEGYTFVIYERN